VTGPAGDPLGHVIVIRHPGVPLSLTDESLWTLEECEQDASQVEAEMPGAEAIVCEVRPVRRAREAPRDGASPAPWPGAGLRGEGHGGWQRA
jgi:hypothetical protein